MPAEPITTGSSAYIMVGAIGAIAGPIYGPAVLMLFGAVIGGLLSLQGTKTESIMQAFRFIMVAVGLSLALTGIGVWLIESFTPLPGSLALMPVALTFAAARTMIIDFIQKILDKLLTLVPGKGSKNDANT